MASGGSKHNMSEETFDYICTSCADENLVKEAIKYCSVCQRYCCHECVTAHKRLSILKGHTLLDNSLGSVLGQKSSLPAFPTEQCSKHNGKILDMYCENHNVVGCYVCVAMDHKTCEDLYSVSDNIDKLYKKSDTEQTKSDLASMLHSMNERQNVTQTLLQQLRDAKTNAVQSVKDYRSEVDKYLDKLEEESIKELERDYCKMESELQEKRKTYEKFIDELKKLDDRITSSPANKAQLFVCSKLARQEIMSTESVEKEANRTKSFEMYFIPDEKLRKFVEGLTSLGKSALTVPPKTDLYQATKNDDIVVKLNNDVSDCSIYGSCIVNDTVLITDCSNNKLKRVDILTLSIVDSCQLSGNPVGVCRVGTQEVAVACMNMVQFVSVQDHMSLSRQLEMTHKCYGIAFKSDKLYITDESKSLYMYDMSANLLKKITSDKLGQPLFKQSNHIVFSDSGDIMFVGDDSIVGVMCFDTNCDHFMTINDTDAKADGVCVDGRENVFVVNFYSNTVAQFSQNGQKRGVVVSSNDCLNGPRSVCFHHGLNRMFVTNGGNKVKVYQLC